MKNFKYLSSVPYGFYEKPKTNSMRRSLDLQSSLKNQNEGRNEQTEITLPTFRPRSPVASLARSLQISKLSKTLNEFNTNSQIAKPVSRYLQKSQLTELVNPHTPFKGSFLVVKKSEISGNSKKKKYYKSVEISRNMKMSKTPKLETVSIKDIKDKKWLGKKCHLILQDFYCNLNKSNGIRIVKDSEVLPQYKYFVGKGNNSKLIKQILSKRNGWIRVKNDGIELVNFIWTEWLESNIIEKMQSAKSLPASIYELKDRRNQKMYQYKQDKFKRMLVDIEALGYNKVTNSTEFFCVNQSNLNPQNVRMYNKLKGNHHLANKKELFANLDKYCKVNGLDVFEYIPYTFHIANFDEFHLSKAEQLVKQSGLWIIKPGENTNRGSGIVICNNWAQVKKEIEKSKHTVILQKYIEKPFLINKRKFDIRLYCLITCFNGVIQAYYYSEGYLRTSSKTFSLTLMDKFVHLTNDAIQKRSEEYGKYENGNKISYNEFQKYLDLNTGFSSQDFIDRVLPKIKETVALSVRSAAFGLAEDRKNFTFEVLGYDFLIDSDLKPWLLEVNTNPCLEISSSHLARIIPNMLDNAFQIAVDSVFQGTNKGEFQVMTENKFELIYHSENPLYK